MGRRSDAPVKSTELRERFRRSAAELEGGDAATLGPDDLLALLDLAALRRGTRALDQAAKVAAAALARTRTIDDERVPSWIVAASAGWVRSARGPFRPLIDALLPRLRRGPEAVQARVAAYYVTGDRRERDRIDEDARAIEPAGALFPSFVAWAGLRGDEGSLERARAVVAAGRCDDLHLAATLVQPAEQAATLDPAWATADAATSLRLAALLLAPALQIEIHWWHDAELGYGPFAEAMTFPWPNRGVRFFRRPEAAQVLMRAQLGDGEPEELEDVGVVFSWLEAMVAPVDRRPFLG